MVKFYLLNIWEIVEIISSFGENFKLVFKSLSAFSFSPIRV